MYIIHTLDVSAPWHSGARHSNELYRSLVQREEYRPVTCQTHHEWHKLEWIFPASHSPSVPFLHFAASLEQFEGATHASFF